MARDPDDGVPRLWNWLKDVPPCDKALVWCHTTNAIRFRAMADSGECKVRRCGVFDEDLLYFFYGRPAYRMEDVPMAKAASQPVVLLFDPLLVDSGKRLYPFDSGAFHDNRLDRWMDPEMELPAFALKCGSEGATRFVAAFFESNDNYLRTQVRKDLKQYGGEFEVSALVRLFVAAADCNPDQPADDRRMALELQFDKTVSLRSAALMGVIYPDELVQAKWFKSFQAECKDDVVWTSYSPHPSKLASQYQGLLEDRARAMQEQLGVV